MSDAGMGVGGDVTPDHAVKRVQPMLTILHSRAREYSQTLAAGGISVRSIHGGAHEGWGRAYELLSLVFA